MDNLAHSLCGLALAETGFSDRVGRKTAWTVGLVSANLADIDLITYPLIGRDHYMLWHRGTTHSLLTLALVPPLVALIVAAVTRKGTFKDLWLLAFLGYLSHLLMDVSTSWGTMLLMPFDEVRISTRWVYAYDIFFWVILSLPFWLGRVIEVGKRQLNLFALGLLIAYVGLCGVLHYLATLEAEAAAERQGVAVTDVTVYPSAFLPVYWNGVASDERFRYQGRVQVLGGPEARLGRVVPTNAGHPAVIAVRETALGARFLDWWAESLTAEVRCDGDRFWVLIGDLRYVSPWLDRPGFSLIFEVQRHPASGHLTVTEHYWSTQWNGETTPSPACKPGPIR